MTTFAEQTWEQREQTLGDPAEAAFIRYATASNVRHVKYGLDRPPISLAHVPPFIRYTPDFLTDRTLVEVQGCGRDQTFKFKHDKMWAMTQWDGFMPVDWFLWNQPADLHVIISHASINYLCCDPDGTPRIDGVFDGHKPYTAVTWDMLMRVT